MYLDLIDKRKLAAMGYFSALSGFYDRILNRSASSQHDWNSAFQHTVSFIGHALHLLEGFPNQDDRFVTNLSSSLRDILRQCQEMNQDLKKRGLVN
ncbi:hypothetical protein UFOVP29_180 [uncultured Caudovirales phage]|uniref:Uncharacterized protein n=1 Tax=uncultured Caudovirales phage TaxID=2100421 RepID=A0A6J5KMK6_9CAUD|nr:hypothetical protein UFOVP29_180 [uncultured Caudovirales phage]